MKKLFLAIAILIPFVSFAQEKESYNESVVVTGTYRPVIEMQNKLNVAPIVPEPDTTLRHSFTYQNSSAHRMVSLFNPSLIKAARVIGEPRTKLYNNYFKLGMGNHWSPYFEGYFHSLPNTKNNYGAYVKHRSHWGKIGNADDAADYYGPAHASLSDVQLFGNFIRNKKVRFSTDLNYQHDYNLYYGFTDTLLSLSGNPDWSRDNLSTSDYAAAYHYVQWNGSVCNIDDAALGYHAALHAGDMFGTYGQNEFHAAFDGHADYAFSIGSVLTGRAGLALQWDGVAGRYSADTAHLPLGFNTALPLDSLNVNRNLFQINPYANLAVAGFDIHLGLRVSSGNYYADNATHTYLMPDVKVSRSFFNNHLGFTLGAVGFSYANTWNSNRLLNPYLAPGYLTNSSRNTNLFLNLRYAFNSRLQVSATAGYMSIYGKNSFQIDSTYQLGNVYKLHIEDMKGWEFGLDLAYVYNDMLSVNLGGHYYGDESTTAAPLLFSLTYDAYLNAHVNIRDKFIIHLQSKLLSEVDAAYTFKGFAEDFTPQYEVTETLPVRIGVNMELEYRHTKAVSFFARIDNLLWQRYYYYANYPTQRGIVTLGLTYTFPN